MSVGVPYRITEESSARNYLRMVAAQLLKVADEYPVGKLAPGLPQSTWVFAQGGQVQDSNGQLKSLWYSHVHILSTDIALVKKFQEDFMAWQKQMSEGKLK